MRRRAALALFALVLVLPVFGLPVVGCTGAADTSTSSASIGAPSANSTATNSTAAATPTTLLSTNGASATSTSISGSSTTEASRAITEQRQRFATVSDLAHRGYAAIEWKSPWSPDWDAELIVYGTVVKVDPARWNTPDGRRPTHRPRSADDNPVIYTTFYVEPTQTIGLPRFGTPVAIMVPFHEELLAVDDEVLVFAEYGDVWGPGTWKQDAYFSRQEVRGIYLKVGDEYLNIDSGQPCESPPSRD